MSDRKHRVVMTLTAEYEIDLDTEGYKGMTIEDAIDSDEGIIAEGAVTVADVIDWCDSDTIQIDLELYVPPSKREELIQRAAMLRQQGRWEAAAEVTRELRAL